MRLQRRQLGPREVGRIHRLQLAMAMRSAVETELKLVDLLRDYDDLAESVSGIQKQLKAMFSSGDLDEAQRLSQELGRRVITWLLQRGETENQIIEDMVATAAMRGAQAADLPLAFARRPTDSLREAVTELMGRPSSLVVGAEASAAYGRISAAVRNAISVKVWEDGLNLSQRLHTRLADRAFSFNEILLRGMQNGRSAVELAKEIQKLDVTDARMPKYLQELVSATRGTSGESIVQELRKAIPEMQRRKPGPLGMRGPSKRLIQAAASGSAERLDAAIENFLKRKARYHAIVIARTEAQNAFRAGHVERAKESPYVIGIKWNLSPSHSRACECELLAEQDLYGLGPGVYPPDELPERPHPNCMCYFTDVVNLEALNTQVPIGESFERR